MLVKSLKILLVFFFFVLNTAKGQDYLLEMSSYTAEDGLSSRFIRAVYEDTKGFVWVATDNGLNRFNGHDFKVFKKEDGLFSDQVIGIKEDFDGNIWVKSREHGLSDIYGWKTIITSELEIIKADDFLNKKTPFKSEDIVDVERIEGAGLFITNVFGELYKYDGEFEKLAEHPRIKAGVVWQVVREENIYILTANDLFKVDKSGGIEVFSRGKNDKIPFYKKGEIHWIKNWLFNFPSPQFEISFKNFTDDEVTLKRKQKLVPNAKLFADLFEYEDFKAAFSGNENSLVWFSDLVYENFPDLNIENGVFTRSGKYWFYNTEGLHVISIKKNRFENFFTDKKNKNGCRGIFKAATGKIIASTHSGILEMDGETGQYEIFPTEKTFMFYRVIPDGNDFFLGGTYSNSLYRINKQTGEHSAIQLIKKDAEYYTGSNINYPYRDGTGKIWIGSSLGLLEYDQELDSLKVFKKTNEFPQFSQKRLTYFEEIANEIWISSGNGLFVLNRKKGIVAQHLPDLRIEHLYQKDSIFWLATNGKGLAKWNMNTDELQFFDQRHGLIDEILMAVYPDDFGHLWVTTNVGLARFDIETERFRVFLKTEGINHNEFNYASHFQDENGRMFFGGLAGITVFDPIDFEEEESKQPLKFRITGYEEIDTKTLTNEDRTTEYLKQKSIQLASSIQTFILKFALLNFENVKNTRYAYKIDGLEEDWTFQKENYLRFSRLPYGEYTLRLKAIDYAGNESEEIIIPLQINAPFYKQLFWQVIAGLLLIGLIFGVFRRNRQLAEKKKQQLEQLVTERTTELLALNETKDRLFAILAHDLRNPVAAFGDMAETINYMMQKNEPEQVAKLGSFIEIEAKQLHHLLDNLLSWAMAQRDELSINFSKINVSEFVEFVVENYQDLGARSGVKFLIDAAPELHILSDRRVLDIVFRNIITNAFRYTGKGGQIKISAYRNKDEILIDIADTGAGMTKKELENLFDIKQRTDLKGNTSTVSLGMHLCQELIELVNGKISAKSQVGKGTLITIKVAVCQ